MVLLTSSTVMRTPGVVSAIIVAACTASLRKLDKHHTSATNQVLSHSNMATILDPRMNLRGFDNVMPESSDSQRRQRAKVQFQAGMVRDATRQRELVVAALEEGDLDMEITEQDPDSDDDIYTSSGLWLQSRSTRDGLRRRAFRRGSMC